MELDRQAFPLLMSVHCTCDLVVWEFVFRVNVIR